jgi:hypothetical protein
MNQLASKYCLEDERERERAEKKRLALMNNWVTPFIINSNLKEPSNWKEYGTDEAKKHFEEYSLF